MKETNGINDVINIFKLRIKLLLSSKKFVVLFVLFTVLTAIIVLSYEEVTDKKNTLPIGIVDLDNTSVTKDVIEEINNSSLLRVVTGKKEDLIRKLNKNEVFSFFVLEKGFTNRLLTLDTSEIIEDNYLSENMVSKVISDAVLAGILDEICYTYCIKTYYKNAKLYSNVMKENQYQDYIKNIYKKQSKTIAFNFKVINDTTLVDDNKLDTELLYKEIIFAISALISAVVVMMIGNILLDDNRLGVNKRFILGNINKNSIIIGDVLAIIFVSNIFGTIVCGLFVKQLDGLSLDKIIKIMLLIFLYECTISMLFVMLTRLLGDIVSYQLVSSIVILLIGITGAMYILGFMINDSVSEIARYTPVGLLINGYKNVIVGSNISLNYLGFIVLGIVMYIVAYIVQGYKNRVVCFK